MKKRALLLIAFCLLAMGCGEAEIPQVPSSPLPTFEASPLITDEQTSEFESYRGTRTYEDEFIVKYQLANWRYLLDNRNPKLAHQTIAGCELWLREPAIQHMGERTIVELTIGEYTWTRGIIPAPRRVIYSAPIGEQVQLFGITYSESTSDKELEQCIDDAEQVIATFEPVNY